MREIRPCRMSRNRTLSQLPCKAEMRIVVPCSSRSNFSSPISGLELDFFCVDIVVVQKRCPIDIEQVPILFSALRRLDLQTISQSHRRKTTDPLVCPGLGHRPNSGLVWNECRSGGRYWSSHQYSFRGQCLAPQCSWCCYRTPPASPGIRFLNRSREDQPVVVWMPRYRCQSTVRVGYSFTPDNLRCSSLTRATRFAIPGIVQLEVDGDFDTRRIGINRVLDQLVESYLV